MMFPGEKITRALDAIENLSRPETWQHLEINVPGYPLYGWIGSTSSEFTRIFYDIMAPLVQLFQMRYEFERNSALLKKHTKLQFTLLDSALFLLFNEADIAHIDPIIPYTPRVPRWREERQRDPRRYWWQGIESDRFKQAVPYFLSEAPGKLGMTLVDLKEFERRYLSVARGGDKRGQMSLGLLANPLYGFTPSCRPVYWRVLVTMARIYQAALGNMKCSLATPVRGDEGNLVCSESTAKFDTSNIFVPDNGDVFPYKLLDGSPTFYENLRTTVQISEIYLNRIVLPRIELRLAAAQG